MWTDGRYFLQASNQMDENWTLMKEGQPGTPSRGDWLAKYLESGASVGKFFRNAFCDSTNSLIRRGSFYDACL